MTHKLQEPAVLELLYRLSMSSHSLKYNRHRERLPLNVSSWPVPESNKRWSLRLTWSASVSQQAQVEATLEAAVTREDIDSLEWSSDASTHPSPKIKGLVKTLLAQGRVSNASYVLRNSNLGGDLEWLSQLDTVRSLTLEFAHGVSDVYLEKLMSTLRSLPQLEDLNVYTTYLRPHHALALYQNRYLSERIPRMSFRMDADEKDHATPPPQPLLPLTGNSHLHKLRLQLGRWPSPTMASKWIQHISKLENLQVLIIDIPDDLDEDFQETLLALSTWIRSPHCQLRHLAIHLVGMFGLLMFESTPSLNFLQNLIPAIQENRSIEHLEILTTKESLGVVASLISPLASRTTCIDYILVGCQYTMAEPQYLHFLTNWQNKIQSIRSMNIHVQFQGAETCTAMKYVSRMHMRWQKWQQWFLIRDGPTHHKGPFCTLLDRSFWANELERVDETNKPELRALSLDVMYYQLQLWLSDISVVPPARKNNN